MTRSRELSLFDLVSTRLRGVLIIGFPLCIFLSALFVLWPELDLEVSGSYFSVNQNQQGLQLGFYLKDNPFFQFILIAVDIVARILLLCFIALLVYRLSVRHKNRLSTSIVVFALLLGPIVIVNGVFKDHWDRARPRELVVFGGEKQFSAAWIPVDQCEKNCSFTSGHAAAGFSFVVMHFIRRGRGWLPLSLICGGAIGWTRIAAGAHFLSDVIFSFFLVYFAAGFSAAVIVRCAIQLAKATRV